MRYKYVLLAINLFPMMLSAQQFFVPAGAMLESGGSSSCIKKWDTNTGMPYMDCQATGTSAAISMRMPNTAGELKLVNPRIYGYVDGSMTSSQYICYSFSHTVVRNGQSITTATLSNTDSAFFYFPGPTTISNQVIELSGGNYTGTSILLRDDSGSVCDSSCIDGTLYLYVNVFSCNMRCTGAGAPYPCCTGPLSGSCGPKDFRILGVAFNMR